MIATPTRCHQALTSESSLTRLTPKVLSRPCSTMMTTNATNVDVGGDLDPADQVEQRHPRRPRAPKSIAAVTATSPRKLNQPTYQAQTRLFLRASRPAQK